MSKSFDTYQSVKVAALAPQIKQANYESVGLYIFDSSDFKHLLTKTVAQAVSHAGLKLFTIYENGRPTTGSYFSTAKGAFDGAIACQKAYDAGMPAELPIFSTVDYDPTPADVGAITDYFTAFRLALKNYGYTAGVYGSGMICRHLSELGLVSHTYLSQSRGFSGYQDWLNHADIVQGPTTNLLGMDIDGDNVVNESVLWSL